MNPLPVAKTDNILTQAVENELLIYNLENHRAVCLNETTAMVWRECDGKKSVAQIGEIISSRLGELIGDDFVRLTLNELKKEKLLENADEMGDLLAGMSRREVVKKVGLASMVALPVISSIVAPNAALAQSNLRPLFASCTTSPQCASGNCFPSIRFGVVCCSATTNTSGLASGDFISSSGNFFCQTFNCCVPSATCGSTGQSICCSGSATVVASPSCGAGDALCQCN